MLDITTLEAWGEFIGGIAVVVSLVYLAVQIRSNTKTVRASNYSDIAAASNEVNTACSGKFAAVHPEGVALVPRWPPGSARPTAQG